MLEPKQLYKRLEAVFDGLEHHGSSERFAAQLAPRVLDKLGRPLGLTTAHLYRRDERSIALTNRWGQGRPDLSAELARRLLGDGTRDITDLPWAGEMAPGRVGLVPASEDDAFLMALFLADGGALVGAPSPAQLASVLTSLHYAFGQHLKRRELEDIFAQARAIQLSLLPHARPSFGDFDIAAHSVPAESVGGDVYDFIHVDHDTLGLTVADSSGHGLPAALQARDVITGLRMGVERDLKLQRLAEKLNRIIHRSGMVSRFISLWFGELEKNGNLTYINAGHPPPMLRDHRGITELTVGGMLLGPQPDAAYKLGFAHLDRGATLAVFTDGVIERGIEHGDGFGEARVRSWMDDWPAGPAHDAVADLFARLTRFDGGSPMEDDVTVVYVHRPA
ncbi:MAG: PP2C family protein-serine/threonine phosphatase [Candidatus Eisenbacteria bacterium]|nr:PP2C family protein-serine/threonine phosphatase [Candidatus Eisenbacteria bacterium]